MLCFGHNSIIILKCILFWYIAELLCSAFSAILYYFSYLLHGLVKFSIEYNNLLYIIILNVLHWKVLILKTWFYFSFVLCNEFRCMLLLENIRLSIAVYVVWPPPPFLPFEKAFEFALESNDKSMCTAFISQ